MVARAGLALARASGPAGELVYKNNAALPPYGDAL